MKKPQAQEDLAPDDFTIARQALAQLKVSGDWPPFVVGYEMKEMPNLLGEPAIWITLKSGPETGNANANVVALVALVRKIQTMMRDMEASVAPVIRIIDAKNGHTPGWAQGPGLRQ